MRILVTGSREWRDRTTLNEALDQAVTDLIEGDRNRFIKEGLTLVSGACPSGADRMAEEWALANFYVETERHPADWKNGGKSAPFVRNAEMVDAGADLCVAFVVYCTKANCKKKQPHESHGTAHTVALARKSGIRTRTYEEAS